MFKIMNQFTGSIEVSCHQDSVPVSLLELVAMILNGPSIKAQLTTSSDILQKVLTIAQLMYNRLVRRWENQATSSI